LANKFAHLVKLALACAVPAIASAQTADNYPSRPIRLIVPVPPGGSTDALARIISVRLGESLHQQIVIDNRAGAGGNIAMGVAAKSTPDGHVLLIVSSNFVVNPSLYAQVPYDPIKDFAPVTYIASAPSLLVEHPSVNAKTVKELVALIKASPGNSITLRRAPAVRSTLPVSSSSSPQALMSRMCPSAAQARL